jgi:hypothetical protein
MAFVGVEVAFLKILELANCIFRSEMTFPHLGWKNGGLLAFTTV